MTLYFVSVPQCGQQHVFLYLQSNTNLKLKKLLHPLKHPAYLPFHCLPLLSYHEKHPIPAVPLTELSQ